MKTICGAEGEAEPRWRWYSFLLSMAERPVPLTDLAVFVQGMLVCFCTRSIVGFVDDDDETLLLSVPRPVTDMATSSPGFRNTGGLLPIPTPAGCIVVSASWLSTGYWYTPFRLLIGRQAGAFVLQTLF